MAEGVMLVAKFSADVSEFVDSVKDVVTAAHDAADAIQQMASAGGSGGGGFSALTSGAKDFGSAIMDMGKGLMDMVFELQMIVDVAKQVGEALFGTAAAAQQSKQEFVDSMKGDVTAANDLYDAIEQLATAKGLDTDKLEAIGNYMMSIGTDAKNVVPELDAVSGAVAKVGGGADMIQSVVTALNKMQDSGKVTTQAITRLQDMGVDAWQALAAGFGTSVPDAMKKVASGTMNSTDAVNALIAGFKKLDGANTETTTLAGSWQKFTDQLGAVASKLFGPIIDGATIALGAIGKLMDLIGALADKFGQLIDPANKAGQQVAQLTQNMKDWSGASATGTQATDTFNAANNQTAGALTKTAAATTSATAASKGLSSINADLAAQIQATGKAAAAASQGLGDFPPSSIQGRINAAADGMSNMTIKITQSSHGVDSATQEMNSNIEFFAQSTGVSFDKATQEVQDYANFTKQSMSDAAKALAGGQNSLDQIASASDKTTQQVDTQVGTMTHLLSVSDAKPSGIEKWAQDATARLDTFYQHLQDVISKVGQLLSTVGGAPGGGSGVPTFAQGVQNYTGMAIVGEAGPELVSLNGGSVYPLTGTGGANLANIGGVSGGTGPVSIVVALDSQVLAQAVFPQLSSSIRMAVGRRM